MSPGGYPTKRVLILGAGFAGLEAAIFLRRKNYHVTLVSERDFFSFHPPPSVYVRRILAGARPYVATPNNRDCADHGGRNAVSLHLMGVIPNRRTGSAKEQIGSMPPPITIRDQPHGKKNATAYSYQNRIEAILPTLRSRKGVVCQNAFFPSYRARTDRDLPGKLPRVGFPDSLLRCPIKQYPLTGAIETNFPHAEDLRMLHSPKNNNCSIYWLQNKKIILYTEIQFN